MKKVVLILAIAIFGVIGVSANTTKPIGMKKNKEIALKQVSGKIVHSQTIKENGKPEYVVEVKATSVDVTKLKIDEKGAVLDTLTVTSAPTTTAKTHKKEHWWRF